ncbi:MAG: hypothetical protein ABIO81_08485 [Ginsengibacter sp.]
MSNCNFSIPFSGDTSHILSKAKSAIETQNGLFDGDTNSGSFEVTVMSNTIRGNYSVSGQLMNIVITNKPFFVPCTTIEGFLRSRLA